jgi:hypothetical protein
MPPDLGRRSPIHPSRTAASNNSRRLWLTSFERRASARSPSASPPADDPADLAEQPAYSVADLISAPLLSGEAREPRHSRRRAGVPPPTATRNEISANR